jgi:hypothetical protein
MVRPGEKLSCKSSSASWSVTVAVALANGEVESSLNSVNSVPPLSVVLKT